MPPKKEPSPYNTNFLNNLKGNIFLEGLLRLIAKITKIYTKLVAENLKDEINTLRW